MKLFLVCDIDNTLVPFRHEIAMYRLKAYLKSSSLFPAQTAAKIIDFVQLCYKNFHARERGEPVDQNIIQQVEEMAFCVENHENSDISWSRELWLYAASSLAGRNISAKVAIDAAGAYWSAIAEYARPYADVQEFFESEWWYKGSWELVLVTSSDARLRVTSDGNRLHYDPEHSTEKKLERIPVALRQWSLPNGIFVGDPVGKPDPKFWEMVTKNIYYDPQEDVAVMIGDSAVVDLTNLPEGFVPILIDRNEEKRGRDVKEARFIIQSFDAMPVILENLAFQAKERR